MHNCVLISIIAFILGSGCGFSLNDLWNPPLYHIDYLYHQVVGDHVPGDNGLTLEFSFCQH